MALGIELILSQQGCVLASFQLGTGVLQGFFGVFQDVVGVLAVAVIDGEVGSGELRLSGATGVNNKSFPMFDRYSESHENHLISMLYSARTVGITHPLTARVSLAQPSNTVYALPGHVSTLYLAVFSKSIFSSTGSPCNNRRTLSSAISIAPRRTQSRPPAR